jgi:hypothetical protein
VISVVALFIALGSGAYAASKIQTNDIASQAVTGKKLAKDAVKSNKTKNGGLKGKDLKDETITASKIEDETITGSKLAHPAYWGYAEGNPANLIRGYEATSATRINAGNYRLEFNKDISQCSYQATPADVNQNLTAHAALDVTNPQRVFVSLRNATNGVRTDGDYQVAVHC